MCRFTPCVFVAILFTLIGSNTSAQQYNPSQHLRCGTDLHLQSLFNRHPELRAINERNQEQAARLKQEYFAKPPFVRQQEKLSLDTLSTVIYIPVVVHIVLPHALRISNQDVELQINLLNTYFAGLNGDSTLIPPAFKPLFGKSKIQFKLAK